MVPIIIYYYYHHRRRRTQRAPNRTNAVAVGSGGCRFPDDDVRYGFGRVGRKDGRAFVDEVRRRLPVTSPSHADDDLPPPLILFFRTRGRQPLVQKNHPCTLETPPPFNVNRTRWSRTTRHKTPGVLLRGATKTMKVLYCGGGGRITKGKEKKSLDDRVWCTKVSKLRYRNKP